MIEQPNILTGRGAWRIVVVDGGIVKFECWDMDEEGNTLAHYSAGTAPQEDQ